MKFPARAIGQLWLTLGATGCVDPVDPPSAYDETVYLCDDDAAFAAEVAACRTLHVEDDLCAGVVSIRGTLDGDPFVLTGRLRSAQFQAVVRLDTSVDVGGVLVAGRAPYFEYELSIASLGLDEVGAVVPRTFEVTPAGRIYTDDLTDVSFRATTGAQSVDTILTSGTFVVEHVADGELAGRLDASAFSGRSRVEGCLHAFETSTMVSTENP